MAKSINYEKIINLSETDLAYFAGLLDGEGHVAIKYFKRHISYRPYSRYGLMVGISNTNFDVMRWLLEHVGGSVQMHKITGECLRLQQKQY